MEKIKIKSTWILRKFKNTRDFEEKKIYQTIISKKNVGLDEGINEITLLISGTGATKYDNANARVGVGDSSATADSSQTGLQGTNQLYKGMDSGYPQSGANKKIVFLSTFGTGEANFTWNEFTVENGATRQKNLNRKVQSFGTKTSGQVWQMEVTINFS